MNELTNMIAGDDPSPWNLLHDGTVTSIAKGPTWAELTVEIPFIRARLERPGDSFLVTLRGLESLEYLPYSDRWDEPELTDLAAIVAAEPNLTEAVFERGVMTIWGSLGSLRLVYTELELTLEDRQPVTLDQLRQAVARFWQDWALHWAGTEVHPLVEAAVREPWDPARLEGLIEAWRTERSSELAETITIVDAGIRGPAPVLVVSEADVEPWCTSWRSEPGAALAELTEQVVATRDLLLDREIPYRECERLFAVRWDHLRRCVAALAQAPADPRIGRSVEAMLRSPSNHWFHEHQVDHVLGQIDPPTEPQDPSFADLALALLDTHADAGTASRIREFARRIRLEADCNDAEMADHLDALADQLATRWPTDRELPKTVAQSLRQRPPGR